MLALGLLLSCTGVVAAPGWLTGTGDDWPVRSGLPAGLTWVDDTPERPLSRPGPGVTEVDAKSLAAVERARFEALQNLLRDFHARLTEGFPERMHAIPVLRLQVVAAGQPYARARQVMVCLGFDRAGPQEVSSADEETNWLGVNGRGVVFVAQPENCVRRSVKDIDIGALNFMLNRNNGSCLISVSSEYTLLLDSGCRDRRPDSHSPVAGLVFPAAVNVAEITRNLLANASSLDQLEAVVLHEAAHYYLAHTASWTANNAYFYFAAELHQRPGAPPPAGHALQEAGGRLIRMARRGCQSEECLELQAHFKRLGLERYTVEQAADEYAVRALLLMGRAPEALVGHVIERGAGHSHWSPAACTAETGQASPSANGWAKPHHNRCFRIYRINRYIEQLRAQGGLRS